MGHHSVDLVPFRDVAAILGVGHTTAYQRFYRVMQKFVRAWFPDLPHRDVKRVARMHLAQLALRDMIDEIGWE